MACIDRFNISTISLISLKLVLKLVLNELNAYTFLLFSDIVSCMHILLHVMSVCLSILFSFISPYSIHHFLMK